MYKRYLVMLGVCLLAMTTSVPVGAQSGAKTTKPAASSFDKGMDEYDALLEKFVDEMGFVNYKVLKQNSARLNTVLDALAGVTAAQYDAMSESGKIALWINAYNALTLDAIIDHYPIEASGLSAWRFPKNSIRQIGGVWDKLTWRVAGRDVTLGGIEHEILRKDFNEPRIHVAINCASFSCPPLRSEAYRAEKLDEQLTDQSEKFLRNNANFRIDRRANVVHLSSIFDWFGKDFIKTWGTEKFQGSAAERAVLNFAAKHISGSDKQYLEAANYKIKYIDYDWSLNEQ